MPQLEYEPAPEQAVLHEASWCKILDVGMRRWKIQVGFLTLCHDVLYFGSWVFGVQDELGSITLHARHTQGTAASAC